MRHNVTITVTNSCNIGYRLSIYTVASRCQQEIDLDSTNFDHLNLIRRAILMNIRTEDVQRSGDDLF